MYIYRRFRMGIRELQWALLSAQRWHYTLLGTLFHLFATAGTWWTVPGGKWSMRWLQLAETVEGLPGFKLSRVNPRPLYVRDRLLGSRWIITMRAWSLAQYINGASEVEGDRYLLAAHELTVMYDAWLETHEGING